MLDTQTHEMSLFKPVLEATVAVRPTGAQFTEILGNVCKVVDRTFGMLLQHEVLETQ